MSKVFPPEKLLEEAIKLGEKISEHSRLIVQLCKESVNNGTFLNYSLFLLVKFISTYFILLIFRFPAFETALSQGLKFEKKQFYATFATVSILNKTSHSGK